MGREERDRPPVPKIPGLYKGKIEAEREIWASRRRATFPETRADIFVIDREAEEFLRLPVLGIPGSAPREGEISAFPLWLPRVKMPEGAIYLSRWDEPKTLDPGRYVAFGGRKYSEGVDLTQVPQNWTKAWLIPGRYETVEDAIEGVEKIADYEGVGGPAQRRVEHLFASLNSLSEAFLHEEITQLRLEGLSVQAESLLREHGLLQAKDKVWKKIADYVLRATSRDIKGRVNPMISRILARAAYLAAVHRELKQRAARQKALKLLFYLSEIQAEGISVLENGEQFLDNLGGFAYAKPISSLNGEYRWIDPRKALVIEEAVVKMGERLSGIEAAPYGPTALLAEAILVGKIGKSNKEIEKLKEKLTERGRMELERKSAADYLMGRDAFSARKRMLQAFGAIHQGLVPPKKE